MTIFKCKKCGEFCYSGEYHVCSEFSCWSRYYMDEDCKRDIYAMSAEKAAVKYCEEVDSDAEYGILDRGHAEVYVADSQKKVLKFFVEAEAVPSYWTWGDGEEVTDKTAVR